MTPVERLNWYVESILSGAIPACRTVVQACQRHVNDLARQSRWRFDETLANRACAFIECLVHVKGKWAGDLIVLEPWQCFCIGSIFGWVDKLTGRRRFTEALIFVPRKNGKALSLDTMIPTPDGAKAMRDITCGDVVFDSDGKRCRVIGVTEAQHDRPCYRVEFSTGDAFIADAEHEWVTDARSDRERTRKGSRTCRGRALPAPVVKTTKQISESLLYSDGERNHRVAVAGAADIQEKELPIDPYLLGYWLGDGNSRSAQITCSADDYPSLRSNVESAGYPIKKLKARLHYAVTRGRGGNADVRARKLITKLRELSLIQNKHIPEVYLFSSIEQRTSLLQGLMDSDGYCSTAGQCEFTTVSPSLASGTLRLIASLGLKATATNYRATIAGRDCGEKTRITFFAYSDTPVFRLTRKLIRQKPRPCRATRAGYRQIVAVTPCESVPVKCIEVDSNDRTYLIGDGFIPTHNSVIGAGIGVYMFLADQEPGAEIYSGATTEKQAWEVFRPARLMVEKSPGIKATFGADVFAKSMYHAAAGSRFEPIVGKPSDGASPHLAIVDEYHEHDTSDLYDTMITGMGARAQPLILTITTAGTNQAGPCGIYFDRVTKILNGTLENDRVFGVLYGIDKEDDWTDLENWKKANPNYGVSVDDEFLIHQLETAKQTPSKQNIIRCKHLNQWLTVDTAWMDILKLEACRDDKLTIEAMKGKRCILGLDLASKIDLAALVAVFFDDTDFWVFGKYYSPRETVEKEENQHYRTWEIEDRLTVTPGATIDYDEIKEDLRQWYAAFGVEAVAYDPFQATQMSLELMKETINMVEVRPTVLSFSEPMKEVESAIYGKRFHYDACPVLHWMFGNVVAHYDKKDNIYPNKARNENKIDGVVAVISAVNLIMRLRNAAPPEPQIFFL